jgi:ribonuclease J
METDQIEIVPLGGVGEFGMNMMALRFRGAIIVIDAGLMFPRDELLGVDFVVPELTYLLDRKEEVRAVILTHGHEDHIGGLPYLLSEFSVPVYGTPLTLGFAKGRLAEHDLLSAANLISIRPRDTLTLGDFQVEFLHITHSIPDAIGLAITTPLGTIIHTGDFKFDNSPPDLNVSDYARLAFYGEKGVLALLSDSTNSERPGSSPSESEVRENLKRLFHISRGKIILACFASSIHRMQLIFELALEFGRHVVLVGRSMKENIAVAQELGQLAIPARVLIDLQEAAKLPEDKKVLLTTGSQGEPMAALARLALGKHKDFTVEAGDLVIISARTIPGNERPVSHLINHFCRRGVRVYDERHSTIHASGHACQDELKLMLSLIHPKFFMPIHGEFRQLYHHAWLAREIGIPEQDILIAETGDIVTITPERASISGKAPVGRRLIDEGGISELEEWVVRDRQWLSEEGMVLAVIPLSKATGLLKAPPELVSRGHVQESGEARFMTEARDVILNTIDACTDEEREDSLILTEMIRADLKRFFKKRTGTRPMIIPVIIEV